MRLGDALKAMQFGRKKERKPKQLLTSWGETLQEERERIPLPEYPRPQLVRKEWRCLNGWWDYAIAPAGDGCPGPQGRIRVPFSPETLLSGVQRVLQPGELLWYMRSVEDLEIPEGCRILLHFGAVDESCCVWWNGRRLGTHRNGYLAFSFDVTEAARPGRNEIRVCVRDSSDRGTACRGKQRLQPGGMFYQAQSGIWQTVWLETVPAHYITGMKITPDLQRNQVEIRVAMNEPEPVEIAVEGKNFRWRKEDFRRSPQRRKAETAAYVLTARIPVEHPRLWTPENPELYPFTLTAGADRAESYFAMRSFGTGTDAQGHPCMTLNGEPYYLHGVLDQGYWPESLMTPPADEAYVYDIREMKRLGFNMIRKHEKVEGARWYAHCDRLGMVVWQDMVHGGEPVNSLLMTYLPTLFPWLWNHVKDSRYRLLGRADSRSRRQFEQDLLRMIRQLYSVPCIGLWGLFNEGWGQFDALRLTDRIHREDPGRPVDHASGWFDQGGGEIKSVHNYFRPLTVKTERRPFVLSEYGGYSCRIPEHVMCEENYGYRSYTAQELPEAVEGLMRQIEALKPEGLAADIYTQVSDVEEETNGLLTYDRKVCKVERRITETLMPENGKQDEGTGRAGTGCGTGE